MLDSPLVFVDLETTGATATHDRVTEVGVVTVDRGRLVDEWSTLVNPGMSIPPAIQSLTGITNDMVRPAPSFAEIARTLRERLEGRLFVAHNARFDYGFLKNEFRRIGVAFGPKVLCTVKLSRRLYPSERRHNLDALLARHDIACAARHRALGDARALWELLQIWRRDRGAEAVNAAAGALLRTQTVPAGLPDDIFDGLPEAPGVYLFHGENDVVLYVGKSVNIRARVMSHFSGDHSIAKDMHIAREVRRVAFVETAGELGALLEESRLVKALAPVHNRQLRRTNALCAWLWRPGEYTRAPQLVTARDLDFATMPDLYGLYRSRATAIDALREIAAAHELCPSVLGLDKRAGPCFAYQLKRCRGVCAGKETLGSHDLRVATALASLRMRPWPFRGRIGVREHHAGSARTALHILDRWCHLGTVRSEDELHDFSAARAHPVFDLDTYRILTRFFAKPPRDVRIVELAA